MGRKIAKEDSRVGHGRGVRCRKRWMGVAIDELGSVDVAPMAGMERTVGGGVRVIACASSTATSADVRVIVCATSTATSTDVFVSDSQSESLARTCECVFSCAHAAAAAEGEGGGAAAAQATCGIGGAPSPEVESIELHRDMLVSAISPGKEGTIAGSNDTLDKFNELQG